MAGNHSFKCIKCGVLIADESGCEHWGPMEEGWYKCEVRSRILPKRTKLQRVYFSDSWELSDLFKVIRWRTS